MRISNLACLLLLSQYVASCNYFEHKLNSNEVQMYINICKLKNKEPVIHYNTDMEIYKVTCTNKSHLKVG